MNYRLNTEGKHMQDFSVYVMCPNKSCSHFTRFLLQFTMNGSSGVDVT